MGRWVNRENDYPLVDPTSLPNTMTVEPFAESLHRDLLNPEFLAPAKAESEEEYQFAPDHVARCHEAVLTKAPYDPAPECLTDNQ